MHITIPCDTIVRLASVIMPIIDTLEPEFQCIRIDNGQLVVTDRRIMAIENIIPRFEGIAYIKCDPAFIEQCKTEAQYSSNAEIIVTPELGFTVAKTSFGYTSGNIGYFHPGASDFDRWRELVKQAANVTKNSGGMYWSAGFIPRLVEAAPSRSVVFAENIDNDQPTLICDPNDMDWIGVFVPNSKAQQEQSPLSAARLPDWMR